MSSDAMTYALENGEGEPDPRSYKTRHFEEWILETENCKLKKRDKSRLCKICKPTNRRCCYEDCFIRFCQTVKF